MDLKVDILLKKQATMSFRQESRCASNGKQREPHLQYCCVHIELTFLVAPMPHIVVVRSSSNIDVGAGSIRVREEEVSLPEIATKH